MIREIRGRLIAPVLPLLGLLLVFLWQMFTASAIKSPTSDERPHIAAGLSYYATGTVELNPEHPPLLKELSALFLTVGGVHWPASMTINTRDQDFMWMAGDAIIAENKPDHVMFWARLPIMLLSACLGLLIYALGKQLLGDTAALCAVFLFVLDPIILAHAYLVTTDSGFAAFTLLFLCTLWNFLRKPEWKRLLCCGVALGAAMSAKFSGVALPPIAVILVVGSLRWPAVFKAGSAASTKTLRAGGAKLWDARNWRGATRALMAMFAIAFVVIQVSYLFPADVLLYAKNYLQIYPYENPNYKHFLAGGFSEHFYSYLVVAFFLKEPVPTLLLALSGLVLVVRDRLLSIPAKLFLLTPPAVLWFGYTINAKNIGVRYLIPVLPFCFLLGGACLALLLRKGHAWKRAAALILVGWTIAGSAGIYPDHLSYFNELACLLRSPEKIGLDGGTRCGTLWLDDSNVDWGGSMKQLKTWLDRNAPLQRIHLANFTGIPPETYGIVYQPIDFSRDLSTPERGIYVVSAHFVARMLALLPPDPAIGYWLRREPDAVAGHSYYIYNLN